MTQTKTKSRARIRSIPAGYVKTCDSCGKRIKFNMQQKRKQVICNVYRGNQWSHVEIHHSECYDGRHGEAW